MKNLIDGIFKESLPGLEKALDLSYRRNQSISSNIANAETPGYRAADLSFGKELEKAFGKQDQELLQTNSKHLDISTQSNAHLIPDLSGATKADGNNVDLDIQMGQLAYNRGRYTQAATLLRKKLSMLSTAIKAIA